MAEASTFRTIVPAGALLAVALILLPASTADASCGSGSRVNHRDAECLSASWNNRGVLKKSPYHVRNMCPEYGKVVAKVDLVSAMDRTLHLDDGSQRDGSTIHRIRGISCCSDIGELCNRSDVVTDAGCVAQFNRVSSAAWTCVDRKPPSAAIFRRGLQLYRHRPVRRSPRSCVPPVQDHQHYRSLARSGRCEQLLRGSEAWALHHSPTGRELAVGKRCVGRRRPKAPL